MGAIKEICMVIGVAVVLFLLMFGICCIVAYFNSVSENKKKRKSVKKEAVTEKKRKYVTFTKRFFKIILINANIWVYLSFILAFMGKQEIAESISVQAIITIIGVFASYCIKSAYEKKIGKEKEDYESVFTEIDQ